MDTDIFGNTVPGQATIEQDLQFNVGFSTITGKKLPSPFATQGVGAVRVFDPNNPFPTVPNNNDPQNYLTKGTLRVFKPLNP